MHKILATAFILALTACYPVHAERITGKDALEVWENGEIIKIELNSGTSSVWSGVIMYARQIHICNLYVRGDNTEAQCLNSN